MQTFEQWRNADPITEMPIPPDWDATIFDDSVPFVTRLKYAKARAHRLAKGSSRAAFVIPYEGRDTVLKIAMNRAGVAQNNAESQLFSDHYLRDLKVTIHMIDHHNQHDYHRDVQWIHTEKADKLTRGHLKKFFGTVNLAKFMMVADPSSSYRPRYTGRDPEIDAIERSPMFEPMENLIGNYNTISVADLHGLPNWGLYQNRPVIIDLGLTDEVQTNHYNDFGNWPKAPRF